MRAKSPSGSGWGRRGQTLTSCSRPSGHPYGPEERVALLPSGRPSCRPRFGEAAHAAAHMRLAAARTGRSPAGRDGDAGTLGISITMDVDSHEMLAQQREAADVLAGVLRW